MRFYEVYCDVEPKRIALAKANADLSAAQDRLTSIKAKIAVSSDILWYITAIASPHMNLSVKGVCWCTASMLSLIKPPQKYQHLHCRQPSAGIHGKEKTRPTLRFSIRFSTTHPLGLMKPISHAYL